MKTTNRGDGGRDNRSLSLAELTRLLELNARPIAISTALALMLCAGYLLLKPPAYRAKATLLLDEDHSDGAGVLGDLARLARPPLAVSEIEVLQSRSIAERTLDGSVDETPSRARSEHRLGLTTLVDEEPSTPLGRALGSGLSATARGEAPRLFAAISKRTADAPDDVRVEFLTPERMRLSTAGFFHRLWPSAPAPLECDYVADRTIQWAGLALRLEVQGNPAGRTFTLRSIAHEDALKMVLKSTRASETARGSGVIELTVDDTDPSRAADIANALCLNYLERSVKRSSRRASQTVDFIETQLVSQNAALAAAEAEVVRLEQQRPQSIDISKAAEGIIGQLNGLEVEIVHNELGRTALHETLELLQAGRLDAVSRLGPEIADPLSLALVQEIATLTSQSEQQDRHDTGPFKALLQAKLADLRSAAEAVALEIEAEQRILALLEQGDASALARTKLDERVVVDPLSTAYLAQFAELSRRLSSLALELTPEHPELVRVKHELQEVRARLQELERSKLAGLEGRASDYRALVGTYEQRLACAPGDERETIAATLEATHFKIGRAAEILGISRKTLLDKRKKYGMK